jgi:hypothetical protein
MARQIVVDSTELREFGYQQRRFEAEQAVGRVVGC